MATFKLALAQSVAATEQPRGASTTEVKIAVLAPRLDRGRYRARLQIMATLLGHVQRSYGSNSES